MVCNHLENKYVNNSKRGKLFLYISANFEWASRNLHHQALYTHIPSSYRWPSFRTKLMKCKLVWSSLEGACKNNSSNDTIAWIWLLQFGLPEHWLHDTQLCSNNSGHHIGITRQLAYIIFFKIIRPLLWGHSFCLFKKFLQKAIACVWHSYYQVITQSLGAYLKNTSKYVSWQEILVA